MLSSRTCFWYNYIHNICTWYFTRECLLDLFYDAFVIKKLFLGYFLYGFTNYICGLVIQLVCLVFLVMLEWMYCFYVLLLEIKKCCSHFDFSICWCVFLCSSLIQCRYRKFVLPFQSCLVLHLLLHLQQMVHLRLLKFYALLSCLSSVVEAVTNSFIFYFFILQLNEVLMPNPFNRPRAVLMLEVRGVAGNALASWMHLTFFFFSLTKFLVVKCLYADPKLLVDLDSTRLVDAFNSKVILGSNKADIQLPGT